MKRIMGLLLFPLLLADLFANNADSTSKSNWAFNLSYPSYFGIFLTDDLSNDYSYYPLGISFSIDWKKETDRIWFSPGIEYRVKTINYTSGLSEKLSLLEFPIKIKYSLFKNTSLFDPYLTSGISVCRFESNITGETDLLIARHSLNYLPILIAGAGANIRLYKSVGLRIESNFGYGLNEVLPNKGYIDLQLGINLKI